MIAEKKLHWQEQPWSKMTHRPGMRARDSSGRLVSLLNDDAPGPGRAFPLRASDHSPDHYQSNMVRSGSAESSSSSPLTPALVRADSYDSNMNDPHSPITPSSIPEFGRQNPYPAASYRDQPQFDYREKMPSYDDYSLNPQYAMPGPPQYLDARTTAYPEPQLYEEEFSHAVDRGPTSQKRYPCRYRDSHGCDKTFTTSGHASRHSKIHTAEKAVRCVHPGCQKKFTRSDNMKQHLETHNKERSRSSSHKSISKTLTSPAGVNKKTASTTNSLRTSRPPSRNAGMEYPPVDPAILTDSPHAYFSNPATSAHSSPVSANSPIISRRESSQAGLDALAIAAAAAYL